ncbi:uncharacterized protein LOC142377828 [Odontesthes bonariensis]|uniref:uncharacterized protein LOC142377828 n=1 Tax=Odontesthes bonariensis TaxID=219752 RepID=UPI003F583E44
MSYTDSFHEIKAQALLQPNLTVDRPVITETDSVTLNCVTPSSVSATQCDFYIENKEKSDSSCVQTLTGAELLKIGGKRSPSEVKVRCFYTVRFGGVDSPSPDSDTSTITINNLLAAKLTVNPQLITETDSVTLNCVTPSSVSVSECLYHFVRGKPAKRFSCLKTLSGAELLSLTGQSSPAKVDVACFYLVSHESPESNIFTITVQLPRPELTVNPRPITETDSVTLNCVTPSSVSASECYLYFMGTKTARTISCVQTLTGTELLMTAHLSSAAEVELTCYYTVEHRGGTYLSPHSDTSSVVVQKSITTPRAPAVSLTTDYTVGASKSTGSSFTTLLTSVNPASASVKAASETASGWTDTASTDMKSKFPVTSLLPATRSGTGSVSAETVTDSFSKKEQWKFILFVAMPAFGVAVGIILLGGTLLCSRRRSGKSFHKRSPAYARGEEIFMINMEYEAANSHEASNMTTSTRADNSSNGFEQVRTQVSQSENPDVYHVYSTIPDEPAPSVPLDANYSSIQAH